MQRLIMTMAVASSLALSNCAQPSAPKAIQEAPASRGNAAPDLSLAQLRTLATSDQIAFENISHQIISICRCGPKVEITDVSKFAIDAVVATEDRRFFDHTGIDMIGLLRAFSTYFSPRMQGGSTLTQQLVKNLMLDTGRDWPRKLEEARIARRLEDSMSKTEILAAYLNQASYGYTDGRIIVGIEQAARFYFGRSAKELSLYESAMLAGMLKGPMTYNPDSNPDLARARALVVLQLMVQEGKITRRDARIAGSGLPRANGHLEPIWTETRNFTSWVLSDVKSRLPGFIPTVRTHIPITLDVDNQFDAEIAFNSKISGPTFKDVDAAYVDMDFDGAVRVIVGQRDFSQRSLNLAVQTIRQPASSFKPVVFAAAVEKGLLLATAVNRHLLAISNNQFAQDVLDKVGPDAVVTMARRLGITSPLRSVESLALGTSEVSLLEMVKAYTPLVNKGLGVTPVGFYGVVDGGEVETWNTFAKTQAIKKSTSNTMREFLRAVVADPEGTGHAAAGLDNAIGKTGTSTGNRDAWFIGSVGTRVSGIWVGRPDNQPMSDAITGHFAASVWSAVQKSRSPAPIPKRSPS